MAQDNVTTSGLTIGMDLGDTHSHVCALDDEGTIQAETRIPTTESGLHHAFSHLECTRVALEAGTHSSWVSYQLESYGHEVIVANPRKLRLVYENEFKDDRVDAENLARLARADPKLLAPISHRNLDIQADLAAVRSRDLLVRTRTMLVNHCRGMVKPLGFRFPRCSAKVFHKVAVESLPPALAPALGPVLELLGSLSEAISSHDETLERLSEEKYPETALLRQVDGVGPITALAYRLVIGNPRRFSSSRTVGAYVGLVPRRHQSGTIDLDLGITKAGDSLLRRLLVQCSHHILGGRGKDCDLRRWGLALYERKGRTKAAKKKAAAAVARKLSVLLHRLWVTAEVYEPLRQANAAADGDSLTQTGAETKNVGRKRRKTPAGSSTRVVGQPATTRQQSSRPGDCGLALGSLLAYRR